MGLGAGGKMRQEIYPDSYGVDTWDLENSARAVIHIANSMEFRRITGHEPPPTPISARQYTDYGLPWFDLYDEGKGDIDPAEAFKKVKSIKQMDKKKGFASQQDDDPLKMSVSTVVVLKS
jgi:hypothetical protein